GLNNSWSNALNWVGLAPPGNGDDVVFLGVTRTTNTNDIANLTLNSITFSLAGFTINGNAITLASGGGGISADALVLGATTINTGLVLPANTPVSIVNGISTLTLAGNVSGAGGITKSGSGTLILSGNNSFSGGLTVSGGTFKSNSAGAIPSGS